MESPATISNLTGPEFSQQGTLDWTQLARSSVTLSLEVLSRLSQAGVEPFTLAVGQAIFSRFLIPPDVQRKIQTTLADLKPFSSYGNVLWFGFGIKHVIRSLVESEQGIACIALCGGLAVSYDKFYCAQVLRSIIESQSAPGHLSPSISQWSNLVDVCSGALTTSEFPKIVEGFCRLWNDADQDFWRLRGATPPHFLGEALLTLSTISSGALRSATFSGGADCAWIAGIAEWVLYLTVEVLDAETGHCLYQKLENPGYETAQVRILRASHQRSSILCLQDKTCFLPSSTNVIRPSAERAERGFAGGRSSWDSILSDTFPVEPLKRLFSSKAGSAFSHILHEVAEQLSSEGGERKNILETLPELNPVLLCVQVQGQTFENAETVIRRTCCCPGCQNIHQDHRELCIHRMANTIIHYLWTLAHLHLHENIRPSSSGLRHLYVMVRNIGGSLRPRIENISHNRKSNMLANVLLVMTGIPAQQERSIHSSALSESGMAIAYTTLLSPGLPPTGKPYFHLAPGHIQKDGALFQEVYDLGSKLDMRLERDAVTELPFEDKLRFIVTVRQKEIQLDLLVKETIESRILQASYSWHNVFGSPLQQRRDNSGTAAVPMPPANILVTAFGSAGLRRRLFGGTSLPHCEYRKVQATTQEGRVLSSICYELSEIILAQTDSSCGFHPQPNQWLLLEIGYRMSFSYPQSRKELPTKIYTGSLVELYSLFCTNRPGKNMRLVQVCASNCLFCTCLWQANKIIAVLPGETPPKEFIFADNIISQTIESADPKVEAGHQAQPPTGIKNSHRDANAISFHHQYRPFRETYRGLLGLDMHNAARKSSPDPPQAYIGSGLG